MAHSAYIGLGSNLGDRERHIAAAVERLAAMPEAISVSLSSLHETEPVGGPAAQGKYLNAVAGMVTTLSAERLLERLGEIEAGLGRVRSERWGPRIIDLDLLLYDDLVRNTPRLTLPHPRMHERRFVLEPLCELAPDARHPITGQTVRSLLAVLNSK